MYVGIFWLLLLLFYFCDVKSTFNSSKMAKFQFSRIGHIIETMTIQKGTGIV